MVLGEVIGNIIGPFTLVHGELALGGAVFDPVYSHVRGIVGSLFHSVVDDSGFILVVSLKRIESLGMDHFFEHNTKGCGIFCIKK